MKKRLAALLAVIALVLGMGWIPDSHAHASEFAEYWDLSDGYWDSGRITVFTPAQSFSTSLTSKACIRLGDQDISSLVSAGWKMANLWSAPKAYYSYPQHVGFNIWQEVDVVLSGSQAWNTCKVYELIHDPSWSWTRNNEWEVWVDHTKRATVYAMTSVGDAVPWYDDGFHAGGRTSNNTLKHWSRISMFELRTGGSGGYWWPVYVGGLQISPNGWLNMITDNSTYNFRVISDNW